MIAHCLNPSRPRRRGFGLIEMAVTGLLLAVAMAATLQVVGWVALDRRAVERRERAVLEVSNLMERVASRPWDELSTEALVGLKLSASSAAFLPGSNLSLKVIPSDDPPIRKQIVIEIRWRDRSARTEAPVRVVAWVHRRGGSGR